MRVGLDGAVRTFIALCQRQVAAVPAPLIMPRERPAVLVVMLAEMMAQRKPEIVRSFLAALP